MKPTCRSILLLCILLLLSGCSPFIKTEQPVKTGWISLSPGTNLGQTFVARLDGLAGVALFLRPDTPSSGRLILHVQKDPGTGEELASTEMPVEKIDSAGYYRFQFPPLKFSQDRNYYLELSLQGEGKIQAGIGGGEAYLNGALYQNGQPLNAQLSFRLIHASPMALLGLFRELLDWLVWIFAGLFLFTLPGWAFGLLLPSWRSLGWGDKLGIATGLGLALYPVLFLLTDRLGLHLGVLYSWIPPLFGLAVLVWRNRFALQHSSPTPSVGITASQPDVSLPGASGPVLPRLWNRSNLFFDLLLLLSLALIFFTRFWVIRNLDAPLWGDSYQHTIMAQLMLDQKGLFSSWEPYVPYKTLTVQFGFPVMVAIFEWLARIGSLSATLVFSQLVNGMAVVAIYPLATRLAGGNRWAGIGAVIVGGLLSPMPGYFVNWGRFAQLAGLAILPVALWLLWEAANAVQPENEKKWGGKLWRTALPAGLALIGMTFSYYRMPFYVAAFMIVWLFAWALPKWGPNPRRWLPALAALMASGFIAGLLFFPWLAQLTGSYLVSAVEGGVSTGFPLDPVLADFQAWKDLLFYLPIPLLALSFAGLLWSLIRREWFVAAQVLWVGLLSAYVAGRLAGLPGANMMQNFAILIALYLPASLMSGWLLGEAAKGLENRWSQYGRLAITLGFTLLALLGAWSQRNLARPNQYAILTNPDLQAMEWIQKNTPADARFLVQGYPIYGGTSAVGSDGGWWISLLGLRENTMPPQYALINEAPIQPDYSQQVVDLVNQLGPVSLDSKEGLKLVCDHGITYIYNGQLQGQAGFGAVQLFAPSELKQQPAFHPVYRQDRVSIYAVDPRACEAWR